MPRPRRCSVKKLFKAIDTNDNGTVSLSELKAAFVKAAGSTRRLSYKKMRSACTKASKYAGNVIGAPCGGCDPTTECKQDCDSTNEVCDYGEQKCISKPDIDKEPFDRSKLAPAFYDDYES